jgi:hypothetical protein
MGKFEDDLKDTVTRLDQLLQDADLAIARADLALAKAIIAAGLRDCAICGELRGTQWHTDHDGDRYWACQPCALTCEYCGQENGQHAETCPYEPNTLRRKAERESEEAALIESESEDFWRGIERGFDEAHSAREDF